MAAVGKLRYAYLTLCSQPSCDRFLYRLARRRQTQRIVEVGIGALRRAVDLIGVCQRTWPGDQTSYAAVDWFEERTDLGIRTPLKQSYATLRATGAQVRLMPGGPDALTAVANLLLETDLVLISTDAGDAEMSRAWFYLPRMCKPSTVVLRASRNAKGAVQYQELTAARLAELARQAAAPRRAA